MIITRQHPAVFVFSNKKIKRLSFEQFYGVSILSAKIRLMDIGYTEAGLYDNCRMGNSVYLLKIFTLSVTFRSSRLLRDVCPVVNNSH